MFANCCQSDKVTASSSENSGNTKNCLSTLYGMEIVQVHRWLLNLSSVDEDESEAVAVSCVELLLSETNAFYQQHCLAKDATQSVSSQLGDNIFDSVFAATLSEESALDAARFQYESRPEAEIKDRHAVRSVPSKSPEKTSTTLMLSKNSSAPASRVGSDKNRQSRRRRKLDKAVKTALAIRLLGVKESPSAATLPVQGIMDLELAHVDEKPDVEEWREQCLKSLESSTRKPGFAKWVTLARAFTPPDSRISMETGVIEAPSANVVAEIAATPVQMKSNVDTFSSIVDAADDDDVTNPTDEDNNGLNSRRPSRRQSAFPDSTLRSLQTLSTTIHTIAENPQRKPKRRPQTNHSSDVSTQQRKTSTMLLTDALSRRKLTHRPSVSESVAGSSGFNSSRSLWRYEADSGSATSRTFVAETAEFNASTLSTTMHVASGVVMSQGESIIEGPDFVEGSSTMSRKRFDLQQRLATDAVLNAPLEYEPLSPSSSNLGSPLHFGHHPVSPLSELHFRDYQEVPPEPIPIPQLSPISTSELAIPRTHLTTSLSTPSLRIRASAASGVVGGSPAQNTRGGWSNRSVLSTSSSNSNQTVLRIVKARPGTALKAIPGSASAATRTRATSAAPGGSRSLSASQSAASIGSAHKTPAKYLREFPKPGAGVIRVVNDRAAGLLNSADDRQRTAWS